MAYGFQIVPQAPMQGVQIGANGMTGYALDSFGNSGFMGTVASSGSAPAASGSTFGSAMGSASIGIAIGQAIGSLYGAWSTGRTLKYVGEKQAQIAEDNRQRGQMAAESVFRQAESQIAQLTYRAGQVKAKQRTAYGANGVAVGVGSSAEVLASTDLMKELDVDTARMNALSAAWGYKNQAVQAGAQAAQFQAAGSYASKAAAGQGFGSLLEGGMLAADRWYKYFGG